MVIGFLRFVSFFGDSWYPYVLVLIVAALFYRAKEKLFALILLIAPLAGDIIKLILKYSLKRPRPGWVGCEALVSLSDYALPSGHTIFYVIFFGLLAWWGIRKRWAYWYGKAVALISIFLIATVGFSRLYLGAHYAVDVVVGYAIGSLILLLTVWYLEKHESKKH